MRRWISLLAGLGLLILLAPVSANAASARAKRCEPKGSVTLAESSYARIYRTERVERGRWTVAVCIRRTGERQVLAGEFKEGQNRHRVGGAAIGGRFIAFSVSDAEARFDGRIRTTVRVRDLRTDRTTVAYARGNDLCDITVPRVVVAPDGATAFAESGRCYGGVIYKRIWRKPVTAPAQLIGDSRLIGLSSLTLDGRTIRWKTGAAPLDPPAGYRACAPQGSAPVAETEQVRVYRLTGHADGRQELVACSILSESRLHMAWDDHASTIAPILVSGPYVAWYESYTGDGWRRIVGLAHVDFGSAPATWVRTSERSSPAFACTPEIHNLALSADGVATFDVEDCRGQVVQQRLPE